MQKIRAYFSDWRDRNPLSLVLFVALVVRLLAVIFAKGYMMFDDHYLIVEPAGGWVNGVDVKRWLPWTPGNNGPHFMSFFYVGIVWFFFEALNFIGIDDPESQMFLLRLVHGLYSILIVYLGYKITRRLSNARNAFTVGMILALLAYFPNFSVKQLVEMVCIPPLMASYYFLIRHREFNWKSILLSGLFAGLAVGIRYQLGLIYVGIGAVLLLRRQWKSTFVLAGMAGVVFFLTQISDIILWKKPFAQLLAYIGHNSTHAEEYVTSPWYKYVLTLLGFLVPPVSVMLLFGFLKAWRKYILIVLPVVLFLVFHSIYPNKQERFILPVIPLIVIVGIIAWNAFREKSSFWQKRQNLHRSLWGVFWGINILVLAIFSVSYTKKEQIEPMIWISEQPDLTRFVIENSNKEHYTMIPKYYLGNWEFQYEIMKEHDPALLQQRLAGSETEVYPNYILFYNDLNLETRRERMEKVFGPLEFRKTFGPGLLDRILTFLNPHNQYERIHAYKIVTVPEDVTLTSGESGE